VVSLQLAGAAGGWAGALAMEDVVIALSLALAPLLDDAPPPKMLVMLLKNPPMPPPLELGLACAGALSGTTEGAG
jgi:hypothetical protein